MTPSIKKTVKRKVVKKKAIPTTSPMTTTKPSKAVLLKAAKFELRIAKDILVQAKRGLVSDQKRYLDNPTKENAAVFRNSPGLIIRANRRIEKEIKNVLRCS